MCPLVLMFTLLPDYLPSIFIHIQVSKPEQGANMGFNDSFYRLNSSRRDATRSSTEHANVFIPAQAFEQANAQTQGQFQSVVSLYKLSERKWVTYFSFILTWVTTNGDRPMLEAKRVTCCCFEGNVNKNVS